MLVVASDRISVFDVVLPDLIPDKGRVLTALSTFWFEQTAHLGRTTWCRPTPPTSPRPRAPRSPGRAMLVQRGPAGAAGVRRPRLPVRLGVVRVPGDGHGHGRAAARRACARPSGSPSRSSRPPPRPRRATTTRSPTPRPPRWSAPTASSSCATVDARASTSSAPRTPPTHGLILADTKLEFGDDRRRAPRDRRDAHARLVALLGRRRLRGRHVAAVVRQAVRARPLPLDRAGTSDRRCRRMPADVIEGTRARYVEAYEQMTGRELRRPGTETTNERTTVRDRRHPPARGARPAGRDGRAGAPALGYDNVSEVSIGKTIRLVLDADRRGRRPRARSTRCASASSPTPSSRPTRSSSRSWRRPSRERAGRRRRLPRHQLRARRRLGGRGSSAARPSCSGTATAPSHGVDAVVVPGGFAHGDYLRTGAIARFSPVMDAVADFAAAGGPVVGICNGFQVLTEAGLLPGALQKNAGLKFRVRHRGAAGSRRPDRCSPTGREVGRRACASRSTTSRATTSATPRRCARCSADDRIVLRYVDNPNGSLDDIAGISNEAGNVVGLMPHPERASRRRSSAPPTASCCCVAAAPRPSRRRRLRSERSTTPGRSRPS